MDALLGGGTVMRLALFDRQNRLLAEESGEGELQLYYMGWYAEGDRIELTLEAPGFVRFRPDRALDEALVYAPEGRLRYAVPTGELRRAQPPQAFSGEKHVISAHPVRPEELTGTRCLSGNPADVREGTGGYPHVWANVETRGESVFAARNVIDGLRLNRGHGDWPYQSWGIGARTDAWIELSFGRPVRVERMALTLRADFPHDAYWTQASVLLSDGYEKTFALQRIAQPQWVELDGHIVTGMRLHKLIKSDDPSAFPALTEWEVYGSEIENEEK